MDMWSSLFFLEYEEPKGPAGSLFLYFSDGCRLWIGMCLGQVLILEYFCVDCIPLVLLSILIKIYECLVWVYLSVMYLQMEFFKTGSGIGSQ